MVQLEPSELSMQPQPANMRAVAEAALTAKASVLRDYPVELDMLERSHSVVMDAGWIVQVLGYLLDNAACYSDPGDKVVIHSESRGNKLLVSVIDRGIGIDPAEHTLIFQRFYRGPHQPPGSKGAGMGLAIARSIVEAHGGTLEVTSQPGRGAAFTMALPLAAE
jgi:two-component system sensor histidine kinase KdpD